ncbi:MAG: hypothetical protein R3A47_11415 [Polyangiales bacterium]
MLRPAVYLLAFSMLLAGIATAADAMVTTPKEELESFASAVTGKVSTRRIGDALSYADATQHPVRVITDSARLFDATNAGELSDYAYQALAPFSDSNLRVIQKSVNSTDSEATVAFRLATAHGTIDALFKLERANDRWWVRSVKLS